MPLESREDYVRLNEHLWELDPIAKEFAESNGYEYWPPLTNGLYPNLSMRRTKSGISQNISFHMEYTVRGERYDEFFPQIAYCVSSASWIDDEDERIRHHGPHTGIRRIPFSALRLAMREFLKYCHAHNQNVTAEFIYSCGSKSPIHGHPLMGKVLYLD